MRTASTRVACDVALGAAVGHLGLDVTIAVPGVVHLYMDVAELA